MYMAIGSHVILPHAGMESDRISACVFRIHNRHVRISLIQVFSDLVHNLIQTQRHNTIFWEATQR